MNIGIDWSIASGGWLHYAAWMSNIRLNIRPDRIHLGTQYYRPPFPRDHCWAQDFARIRASGLDCVQLWVVWGWVEPQPGQWRFEDYDRLIDLAAEHELGVVLSLIAEVQPDWIHRELPDCHLVTHHGQRVHSERRVECHVGCTPGGCTDHPGVWTHMQRFLETTVTRYRDHNHLVGWDAWNELRWNVGAESAGLACYCPHTVAAYRRWLCEGFGEIEKLNASWLRRYTSWDEIEPPRHTGLPSTDWLAWLHFHTERANRHGAARYRVIKTLDPHRPVTAHGAEPSPGYVGRENLGCLDRGNDWALAETLDGIGCSSFPNWFGMDDLDFALRMDLVRSAAGDKRFWLSELQGGRAALHDRVMRPVRAHEQQRWIWNGLACGADTILFWCWRDEVFGRESGGFGIVGRDGFADERLAELRRTGTALREHGALLAAYRPDPAAIGVLFSPTSYALHYAQCASAKPVYRALTGTCRALIRNELPYRVLEETRLDATTLSDLKLIFLPRCDALPAATRRALADWVRAGGVLVGESECGAFDEGGFYDDGAQSWLTELTGVEEVGRREVGAGRIALKLDGEAVTLPATQWLTPMRVPDGACGIGDHPDGALLVDAPLGAGRVIRLGTHAAEHDGDDPGYERFVSWAADRAGVQAPLCVCDQEGDADASVLVRTGSAAGRRLCFVFAPPGVERVRLTAAPDLFTGAQLYELRGGQSCQAQPTTDCGVELTIAIPAIGFAILAEDESPR